jgi:outer membrane protein OmpA-like peptidoglycan-associated protein/tetratricopeptide (TPR) repeat protein
MKVSSKFILSLTVFLFAGFSSIIAQEDNEAPCKVDNKKATKLFESAMSEYKSYKITESLKTFKEVVDMEPDYVDAYFMIGKINMRPTAMNFITAKKYLKKVIELCPTYPDPYVYYYLGEIYYAADKLDTAYLYMKEFIKDPDKIKKVEDYNRADSIMSYTKTFSELMKSPVPFNPVCVKGINTKLPEYLPTISPDNELALFTRRYQMPPKKDDLFKKISFKEKFMFSERKNGSFDEGQEMPSPFNLNDNEGGATVTIDNRFLYYTVCKWLSDNTYFNCDICMSENVNGSWTEIKNLGTKVNGNKTWEAQPSISSDGKTLYFISDRTGGLGGYDIYRTVKNETGEWGLPENMGPGINTSANEKTPFIHTDDQTFYFSSQGWPGLGGYDIFFCKKGKDGKWGKPRNIGYPINTVSDDVGFFVSTDGQNGYFASNDSIRFKGVGNWDIYSFELYKGARPDTVLFIKGNVRDEFNAEPVKAKVQLKNAITKQVTEIAVDTLTGKYVVATVFRNDYVLTVKSDDYAYNSRYISKEDSTYNKPATVDFNVKPIEVGQAYKLNDIYFAYGKFDLTQESMRIIDDFIDYLKDHPSFQLAIYGHTDNVSDDTFNQVLSENRAKSVYEYMIQQGIPSSNLSYKGFGESKPVASNATEEGRSKNRRTEFVVVSK